jgi:adenosine deaminase
MEKTLAAPLSSKDQFYRQLPKVELHRHLEGSLRVATLEELAREYEITLPPGARIGPLVQVQADEPFNMINFLAKFQTLRLFYLSPEIITRVVYEAVADAAADGIRYLELMFTPVALSRARGFPKGQVMDWVIESALKASSSLGITTRLIVSVNRHEDPALAEEVAGLAAERFSRGIVGLNLAGNEAEFPAKPFAGIFRQAKTSGLAITIHAGEWGGAENVREAIEDLQADRIGHGVRVLEDANITAMARERGTAFEVCITSNYQTGVTPSLANHPLGRMLAAGLNVVLNTDDPGISQITLTDEYRLACETLGLSRLALKERIIAAAKASFLPEVEKKLLVNILKTRFVEIQ